MVFVYKVKNAIFIRKQKFRIENIQNSTFVIHIFYKQNIINIYQNNITFNVKK